ncbi:Protein jagunal-like protein [Aphelenchoides besseyi]|nr:Protein jagunal-like protein [Aphelenchoides besseyi]KAI6208008.1 Protein jagunal-like protein [Aphelenchoides besseyi]
MASKGGPRAVGTDGTDFGHRQRVANSIKMSVQMKFYLKGLFSLHILVLMSMWAKVGSELARREFGYKSSFFEKLDLPSAYPWEYVWCLSFIPIIFGFLSFAHNKARLLRIQYYSQYIFGILPCCIGLGGQIPELIDYIFNMENSKTPTFKGAFPMVVLWYIFFLIAFQIHIFALYFSYHLLASWQRDVKKD